MIIYECKQGSPEWHQLRLGKMTASHALAIATAGKGLDTYCKLLAAERFTGIFPESYSNQNMQIGVEEEQFARMAYELEYGCTVKEVGFIEYNDYCGSSPDGLVNNDSGLEIKRKTFKCHNDILLGEPFESQYLWQCHMNMFISDRQWWHLCSFNPQFKNRSLFVHYVERDKLKDEQLLNGIDKGIKLINNYYEMLNNK